MNTQRNTPSGTSSSSSRRSGGTEAGGQQEGLRHPVDDGQRVKQRLDEAGLDDQGDAADDQLRDRRSSGTRSGEKGAGEARRRH